MDGLMEWKSQPGWACWKAGVATGPASCISAGPGTGVPAIGGTRLHMDSVIDYAGVVHNTY